MEKLYVVTVSKLKNIKIINCKYRFDKINESKRTLICIKDDNKMIDIDTNEEYEILAEPYCMLDSNMFRKLKTEEFAIYAELYSKKNVDSIKYLKAIRARKILDTRKDFEQSQKTKVKVS